MALLRARTERGFELEVLALEGEMLDVRSPQALPPGLPLRITLELSPEVSVETRTVRSQRQDAGAFALRLRLVSLRREARQVLADALKPNSQSEPPSAP